MTNEQIKQAYVVGKAAKGIIRYREFQKQAMMKQAADPSKSTLGDYAVPTLTGAGITSLIGALIQAAQGKDILKGMLVGAIPGGIAGAGYQAAGGWDGLKNMFKPTESTTSSAPGGTPAPKSKGN